MFVLYLVFMILWPYVLKLNPGYTFIYNRSSLDYEDLIPFANTDFQKIKFPFSDMDFGN